MMHAAPLSPYDQQATIHLAGSIDTQIAYVPAISEAAVKEVTKQATIVHRLVIYSWQPGLIRQRIETENVVFEKIPEFLVKRFGVGSRGTK